MDKDEPAGEQNRNSAKRGLYLCGLRPASRRRSIPVDRGETYHDTGADYLPSGDSMRLELKLAAFVIEKDLGMVYDAPIDVYLAETETYQPDIIYISKDRLHIIEPAMVKGAPDLVIEILSPSTAYYDLREKFKVYARHGVKEYWIVDPHEQSIEVYRGEDGEFKQIQRVEKEGKAQSAVLQGFAVEVKDIFVKLPG